jgi:hypothetical protein
VDRERQQTGGRADDKSGLMFWIQSAESSLRFRIFGFSALAGASS